MNYEERIDAFTQLGTFLKQFTTNGIVKNESAPLNEFFFDAFKMQIKRAGEFNGWFTEDNVLYALESWSELLNSDNLYEWVKAYGFSDTGKTVAVIMAGNIPLVGFHDFLSVLISGHRILVKQSSNDKHFLPLIAKFLEHIDPRFKERIRFTDDKLEHFDAVIATGSNNTARYFDYYFGKYPSIIRRNRNAVAVLSGNETDAELKALADDIFVYFGLGCRSVAKLFVPSDFDFDRLFKNVHHYHHLIKYKKYENNYNYNKAVYLMSNFRLLENGFLMLKEDTSYSSPIATLFYENYDNFDALKQRLQFEKDQIQCIVSNLAIDDKVDFGQTQKPQLSNYADGVDTLKFLSELK